MIRRTTIFLKYFIILNKTFKYQKNVFKRLYLNNIDKYSNILHTNI